MNNCPKCSAVVQQGWKACPKCGDQFAEPVPPPTAAQTAKTMRGVGIFIVVVLVLCGWLWWHGMEDAGLHPLNFGYFTESDNQGSNPVNASPAPMAQTGPTAVSVDAETLNAAYAKNAASADILYKDKLLDVTGVVSRIDTTFGSYSVSLRTSDGMNGVDCLFKASDRDSLARLVPGDLVCVEGTGSGQPINVVLSDCVIKSIDSSTNKTQ